MRATAVARRRIRTGEVMDTLAPASDVRIPPKTATDTAKNRRRIVMTSAPRIHCGHTGLLALLDRAAEVSLADRSWSSRILAD
jgi:hypothetical protein